jgi:hypothetical protein
VSYKRIFFKLFIVLPLMVISYLAGAIIHGLGRIQCALGHLMMTNPHTAMEEVKQILYPSVLLQDSWRYGGDRKFTRRNNVSNV